MRLWARVPPAIALAQHKAQRLAFQQRKAVLKTDEWLEDSLSFAGPLGGLAERRD